MPAPAAVYVGVVVGVVATVAAAFAFKEFVYEPHLAPRIEAFAESFIENRRRERARRQGPIAAQPVSARAQDENQLRRNASKKGHGNSSNEGSDDEHADDPTSIELQDLVSREVDDWRGEVHRQSTLRNRKVPTVIDESNSYIPFNPMTPSQVIFDAGPSRPRSPSIHSQQQHLSRQSLQPSLNTSRSSTPRTTVLQEEMQHEAAKPLPVVLSPRLPTPISNLSPASTRATSPINSQLDHSVSSMSSFAPAVVGPRSSESIYGSPRSHATDALSDAGHSDLNMPSNPTSRVASPFSDMHMPSISAVQSNHSGVTSPFVLSPRIDSDFEFSDTSDGMLSPSLRSGMFSPSLVDEDPFEVGSVHESESSWGSLGRRTPEL